jgi:maltooligosyltrehalose trehalohydrolase
MFNFYKKLIEIRKTHLVLSIPDRKKMSVTEHNKLLIITRWQGKPKILMFVNFNKRPLKCKVDTETREYHKIIDSSEEIWRGSGSQCPTIIKGEYYLNISNEQIVIYSTL